MVFPEGLLHRMENISIGKTLNGFYVTALGLKGQHGATFHRHAVHMNNTSAALTSVAAHVRACETQLLSDKIDQERAALYLPANGGAVYGHRYRWHLGLSSLYQRVCRSL